jgi:hypothetical protein
MLRKRRANSSRFKLQKTGPYNIAAVASDER